MGRRSPPRPPSPPSLALTQTLRIVGVGFGGAELQLRHNSSSLPRPSFRTEQADFFHPASLLRTGRPAQREISLLFAFISRLPTRSGSCPFPGFVAAAFLGGLSRLQRRIHPASVAATSCRLLSFSVIPSIVEGSWLDVRIGTVDGIISPLPRVSSRTERGICFSLRL
jgi:hypothetical protein